MFKSSSVVFVSLVLSQILAFGQLVDRSTSSGGSAIGLSPVGVVENRSDLGAFDLRKINSVISSGRIFQTSPAGTQMNGSVVLDAKKQILREKLFNAIQGTETSGGGSFERRAFYEPLGEALRALRQRVFYDNDDKTERVDMELLTLALRAITPVASTVQLFDRQGKPVNFYNDPDTFSIYFNLDEWNRLSKFDKIQFGLHELMGLIGVRDSYYRFSKKLAELAFTTLEAKAKLPKLFWVAEAIPGANPLRILNRAKQTGTHAFIANDCERYKFDFLGLCVVMQSSRDGVEFEEVLLIDE